MVLAMLRMMMTSGFLGEQSPQEQRSMELVSGDFSDAKRVEYCHGCESSPHLGLGTL